MIELQDLISPTDYDPMINWILLLLGIPLLSFISSLFIKKNAPIWSTFLLLVNTGIAIFMAFSFWYGDSVSIKGVWFTLGDTVMSYSFYLDRLALLMIALVNLISFLVHVFSMEYMKSDRNKPRYFAYLGLFTFSMLGIVLFHNLLLMFIFWELVGFTSYLLIGFWFEKKTASLAANKAFIMNRIGDAGMLTGLMILFAQFSTFDLEAVKALMIFSEIEDGNWVAHFTNNGQEVMNSLDGRWLSAAGIALFCGAVGKSAQFPLQVWLPDAMEGPTPVSALIHAATMVAAGVFLLARVFVLLDAQALEVVAIVGAITAFMAAIAALSQFDIKKVLAYSTISQLGYMVMAIGVGAYSAGLFHLVTHAFFKAGLFLCAGIIIHQLHKLHSDEIKFNEQDIRVMGGLRLKMPVTFLCFLICSLALAGLPGFSGFLSKDAILLNATAWAEIKGGGYYIVIGLAYASVILTAIYIFRLVFLVFTRGFRLESILNKPGLMDKVKEGNLILLIPAILLAVGSISIVFGANVKAENTWFMQFITNPIYLVPESYAAFSLVDLSEATIKSLHGWVAIVSISLAVGGLVISYFLYRPISKKALIFQDAPEPRGALGRISFNHWYQDVLYEKAIVKFIVIKGKALAWFDEKILDGFVNGLAKTQVVLAHIVRWFDKYIIDGFVHLTVSTSGRIGQATRSIQSGNVQTYILSAMILLILLLLWLMI